MALIVLIGLTIRSEGTMAGTRPMASHSVLTHRKPRAVR